MSSEERKPPDDGGDLLALSRAHKRNTDSRSLSVLQGTVLVEREIRLDDQIVGDASPVKLGSDIEEVLLVVDLQHHSMGAIRHGLIRGALACGMHQLRALEAPWKVGPNDAVVIEGTPRPRQGGEWGNGGRGGPGPIRRTGGLGQATGSSYGVRVRGPRVGTTAVVVRACSCPHDYHRHFGFQAFFQEMFVSARNRRYLRGQKNLSGS